MQRPIKAPEQAPVANGPAAAAFLAAGLGSLALGMITSWSEASTAVSDSLNLYNPVGPLSGQIVVEVIVWIVSWIVLHTLWKQKQVNFGAILTASLVFIALGFLGTFPIFFNLFLAP